jgi:hypothetical protein
MPSQIPASSARTQRPHAHQSVPALDPQRNPIRCSGHQSPTDAACRDDSQAGVRSLHLDADGAACAAKGRGHRSRGNEQGRRPGSADAGHSTSRALAGVRPLGAVRPGAAASEGPPQSRILSARPTKRSSPTWHATSFTATSSCRSTSIRSRPNSETKSVRASASCAAASS